MTAYGSTVTVRFARSMLLKASRSKLMCARSASWFVMTSGRLGSKVTVIPVTSTALPPTTTLGATCTETPFSMTQMLAYV